MSPDLTSTDTETAGSAPDDEVVAWRRTLRGTLVAGRDWAARVEGAPSDPDVVDPRGPFLTTDCPDPAAITPALLRWSTGTARPGRDARPCTPQQAARLVGACRDHRIIGVLVAAVRASSLDPDDPLLDELAAEHDHAMIVALGLERLAVKATSRLCDVGIPHRLLKGCALANASVARFCPDGSGSAERSFADVDLLVPSGSVNAAVESLRDLACVAAPHRLGADFDDRFSKSVTLRTDEGFELDIHRTLAGGPWGFLVDPDTLWSEEGEVTVSGTSIPTFSRPVHTAHAVMHAALGAGPPRLVNLRDIVLLDGCLDDDERRRVREILSDWRATIPARRVREHLERIDLTADVVENGLPDIRVRERAWDLIHRRWPDRFGPSALAAVTEVPAGSRSDYLRCLARLAPGRRERRSSGGPEPVECPAS